MGIGFAPTWLRQVSPPPCLTTLTTVADYSGLRIIGKMSEDRQTSSTTV